MLSVVRKDNLEWQNNPNLSLFAAMNIELRQLRHFVALIEFRNFTAAAQAMKISQPAFSRSIQSLEQTVGARLINRQNPLEPTKRGLLVLEHARQLINQSQDLVNDIAAYDEKESGEIRFGLGPAPAAWLLPQVMGVFTKNYPRVRQLFRVDNWQALGEKLQSGEFSFIVADSRNFEFDTRFHVLPLIRHRWGFCCRSQHPLASQTEITVSQLFSYPVAATLRPPNLHRALVQLSGRQDIRTSIECENGYSLLEVVRHSDAIGTTNYSTDLARQGLKMLKIAGLDDNTDEFYTHYGIISLAGARLPRLTRTLMETFMQTDKQLYGASPVDEITAETV